MKKSKKGICFLISELNLGGTERVLMDTIPCLTTNYEVTIISLYFKPNPSVVETLERAGAKVIFANIKENGLFSVMPYFSRFHYEKILKNIDFDYLISVNLSALNASFVKKAKKTILWNHMDNVEKHITSSTRLSTKFKKFILRRLHKQYDAIWTVCDKVAQDYKNAFNLNNVYVLPNPLNYNSIIQKSNQPCNLKFNKEQTNIITIGRFTQNKGMDRLINIFAKDILPIHPNTHLYIIAWGWGQEDAKSLINDYNISDNVSILGLQENPFPYLKQADLFVCPSRQESFGLVIIEAMALGIPIITTATSGGLCTTQNGTLATCVENTDEALAFAILTFLNAPDKYPYSLDKAKQEAQSYDLPHYQEKLFKLIQQLEEN